MPIRSSALVLGEKHFRRELLEMDDEGFTLETLALEPHRVVS